METEAFDPSENRPKAEIDMRESAYIRPTDTTGLVFMSIIALVLLIQLLRSQKRYRNLLERLSGQDLT